MKKKTVSLILAMMLLVSVLSGCGGTGASSKLDNNATEAAPRLLWNMSDNKCPFPLPLILKMTLPLSVWIGDSRGKEEKKIS